MRPKNWRELEIENRKLVGLAAMESERMVRLARFVDELPGVRADYQPGSDAPRPSWGTKLAERTIWYVGYKAYRDEPILKVLPSNGGWPKLPEGVKAAFVAGLTTLERDTNLKLGELTETDLESLEEATRAAAQAFRQM